MKTHPLYWIFPAALIATLFFGCERQPGEKLYYESLAEWKAGNHVRARALLDGRLAPSIDDVTGLAESVLQHRMALTFAARADGHSVREVIGRLVARIA